MCEQETAWRASASQNAERKSPGCRAVESTQQSWWPAAGPGGSILCAGTSPPPKKNVDDFMLTQKMWLGWINISLICMERKQQVFYVKIRKSVQKWHVQIHYFTFNYFNVHNKNTWIQKTCLWFYVWNCLNIPWVNVINYWNCTRV